MTVLNGVDTRAFGNVAVINGGKQARINANYPYEYDKWRMVWNGYHFAPPDAGSVLYLPGMPGAGSTIQDFSFNFTDSAIDTDEVLDATETGVDCDADATTAIPVNSVIRVEGELMLVTATGVSLTVTRGYLGSTAATHATNQDIFRWLPNNGTITGATWARLSSGLWVLDFVTDDFANCGNNASLNFTSGDFSFLFWARIDTVTSNPAFFCRGSWTNDGYFAYCDTNRALHCNISQAGAGQDVYTANNVVTLGKYHLILVTRSGATVTWAIDGVEPSYGGQPAITNPLTSTRNFRMGILDNETSQPFDGRIALFRGFSQVTSVATSSQIYNQERHLFNV